MQPNTDSAVEEGVRVAILEGEFPGPLREELASLYESFVPANADGARLAVRSSATLEDGDSSSAAGQYTSVLDVASLEDFLRAVKQCWASQYTVRVWSYLRARGVRPETGEIGVLVQTMIQTSAAGVLFSANVVSGSEDECVITAVPGLGERAASGESLVDTYYVSRSQGTIRAELFPFSANGEADTTGNHASRSVVYVPALSADQIGALVELTFKLEAHFPGRLDIEFGFDGPELWLLQVRPATTPVSGVEGNAAPASPRTLVPNQLGVSQASAGPLGPGRRSPLPTSFRAGCIHLVASAPAIEPLQRILV